MRFLLFICPLFILFSCSNKTETKQWHPNTIPPADTIFSFSTDADSEGEASFDNVSPAMIPLNKVNSIHIGDPGEKVYHLTKNYYPQYPSYWKDGSIIRTTIKNQEYAVAYLLDTLSGVIKDISYREIKPSSTKSIKMQSKSQ